MWSCIKESKNLKWQMDNSENKSENKNPHSNANSFEETCLLVDYKLKWEKNHIWINERQHIFNSKSC